MSEYRLKMEDHRDLRDLVIESHDINGDNMDPDWQDYMHHRRGDPRLLRERIIQDSVTRLWPGVVFKTGDGEGYIEDGFLVFECVEDAIAFKLTKC